MLPGYERRFELDLPFGTLVALSLPPPGHEPEEVLAQLRPEERAHLQGLRRFRRTEWIGGRLAMRAAAARLGVDPGPVLPGEQGAPILPPGLSGSIAHKRGLALAILGRAEHGRLGVDVEEVHPPRPAIATRILRPEEQAVIDALPESERWEATLLRFAVKESIYKALWPEVRRYVSFQEARVWAAPLRVELCLAKDEGPFQLEALSLRREELMIAAVRLRRYETQP